MVQTNKFGRLIFTALFIINNSLAFGETIVLKHDTRVQVPISGDQERIGILTAGSEVEIPDAFVKLDSAGKKSWDLTLQNWLTNKTEAVSSGQWSPGLYKFEGERTDYFFPVKVKLAKPGSTASVGAEYFVRLQNLATKGEALFVDQDSAAILAKSSEPEEEAATVPFCETCHKTGPIEQLLNSLAGPLGQAERARSKKLGRIQKDQAAIPEIFKKSCGINYNSFISEIRRRLEPDQVRTQIFIDKINLEASGRCYIRNEETDQSSSIGIFQINSRGAKFSRCSVEDRAKIVDATIAMLKQGPKCLENPLVNFEEALRIYKGKEKSLFGGPTETTNLTQKADRERIIVAAYNGGESYVHDARRALAAFNSKNATNLDPNSWDDLKPFFFRQALSVKSDEELIGDKAKYRHRRKDLLISNIAHAETLVPVM